MTKLPNIFQVNRFVLTQSPHGASQSKQAIDTIACPLITPFDGCEVTRFVEAGYDSFFDLRLPNGDLIQCVHGRPTKEVGSTFSKGEIFGQPWRGKDEHWHIAIKVKGTWKNILNYIERNFTIYLMEGFRSQHWKNWDTYLDEYLEGIKQPTIIEVNKPKPMSAQEIAQHEKNGANKILQALKKDTRYAQGWVQGRLDVEGIDAFAKLVEELEIAEGNNVLRLRQSEADLTAQVQTLTKEKAEIERKLDNSFTLQRETAEKLEKVEIELDELKNAPQVKPEPESFSVDKFLIGLSKNGQLYTMLGSFIAILPQGLKIVAPEYSEQIDALSLLIAGSGILGGISNASKNITS